MLGKKVKDKVSGFEGIVVAKIKFIDSSVQYIVKPIMSIHKKMRDVEYFSKKQLKIIGEGVDCIPLPGIANLKF
jgi:hypothetical protein